ncbi:MAG: metallophosphoesterase [Akkermansia sp.]|nr:metallophosphoesterase [Akkermansia sp.]
MILYATIFALAVSLYIAVRAIAPLRVHAAVKVLLLLLTLIAAFKFHILYMIEGENFFTPALPPAVVWSGCWLFCAVTGYALFLLAADIIRLPLYLGLWLIRKRRPGETWRSLSQAFNLSLLLLIMGLTAHGTYSGTVAPQVTQVHIKLPHMPASAAPLRLVQLSDLHADSTKNADFYRDIVERTNALKPDIVLITGDLADGPATVFGKALEPLADLDSPLGIYAVTGNHDCFHGTKEWLAYLRGLGVTFIDGEVISLSTELEGGIRKELRLIGVPDPIMSHSGMSLPSLSELTSDIKERSVPTVLLAHRPNTAAEAAQYPIDLQLSGHTHGGQFPGLQQMVARMNGGYVYGLYRVGDMQLYVSPGTSLWTPVCLRIGVPPEITLITLQPTAKEQ